MGQKKKNKAKKLRIVNTLKRKDLKNFNVLPAFSVTYKKLKYKSSYHLNIRIFNIWINYKLN
jgi:hypothetical protein|tara:strand:- start:729 stop:914 length:186 start_codon:yes stop_codon:yes gene_type:complete